MNGRSFSFLLTVSALVLQSELILATASATTASPATETQPTDAQAAAMNDWREAGLSFPALKQRLFSNAACESSEANFAGCVYVINSLLAQGPTPRITVPRSQYAGQTPAAVFPNGEVAAIAIPLANRPGEVLSRSVYVQAQKQSLDQWFAERNRLPTGQRRPTLDFEGLINSIESNFPPGADRTAIAAFALNGWTSMYVDDHARFEPLATYERESQTADQSFVGIGVEVNKRDADQFLEIVRIIPGGPSERSTLRAGAIITAIDGTSVASESFNESVARIVGTAGSEVRLTLTTGTVITITRQPVIARNVDSRVIEYDQQRLGYVRLATFNVIDACEKTQTAVTQLKQQRITGLVFDLRGNGGGHTDQAKCIAEIFLPRGRLVAEFRPVVDIAAVPSLITENSSVLYQDKLVVLVNSSSASASELLAGALADHQRATLVGERTFGKGTMQMPMVFTANAPRPEHRQDPTTGLTNILQWFTHSRFYQPSGNSNQLYGIYPHLEVLRRPDGDTDPRFREETFSINPVPSDGQPVRRNLSTTVTNCITSNSRARQAFTADPTLDYQLLTAQEVLSCEIAHAPRVRSRQ